MSSYRGLLFIGDPHLASRTPGFRKDEYTETTLEKLRWSLNYARTHSLLPCLLGDLFHLPRDNSNWLVGDLCAAFLGQEILTIYGNHDCRENTLKDDDTLMVFVKAGLLRLVSDREPWRGKINGRDVVVGGTSFGQFFPSIFHEGLSQKTLVFWMAHHDVLVPGYEEGGRVEAYEIPGIHVVVNGHIHRRLEDVVRGKTRWITPGNITRIKRSDRDHIPSILRVDVGSKDEKTNPRNLISPSGGAEQPGLLASEPQPSASESNAQRATHNAGANLSFTYIEVPHEPFENVFYEEVQSAPVQLNESVFVRGLAELQARRTQSGEGLQQFLEENLPQFEPAVADQIRLLAQEVMTSA